MLIILVTIFSITLMLQRYHGLGVAGQYSNILTTKNIKAVQCVVDIVNKQCLFRLSSGDRVDLIEKLAPMTHPPSEIQMQVYQISCTFI